MGTTSRGYPYPNFNVDGPNGAAQIQALANAINGDVQGIITNVKLGTTPLGASGYSLTAATGFGTATVQARIVNGWAFVQLQVLRSGATITAPSTGNIANTQMGTLTGSLPPVQVQARAYCSSTGGTSVLNTDGTWFLTDMNPTSTLAAGELARATFVFPT